MEIGFFYDIEVEEIDDYYGAKEIKKLKIISKKTKVSDIQNYHTNGAMIDLKNPKYQNEVITNLKGTYSKNYLHYVTKFGKEKIRLYFKKDLEKPKSGVYFVLENGILSNYRSKPQIIINNNKDYKIYIKKQ